MISLSRPCARRWLSILLVLYFAILPESCNAIQRVPHSQQVLEADRPEIEAALRRHEVHLETLPQLGSTRGNLDCKSACQGLKQVFGSQVISRSDGEGYNSFTSSYWSMQQAEVSPACIFIPESSKGIAIQLLISRLTACPFAVKGGGHASFAGSSSIENGIVVSLRSFSDITLSADRATVTVGAGTRWGDVYAALEPHDLTVVGGRNSDVGVGGLTLGGGMSFFSNMHGLACDNVAEFEVVLASGEVVVASAREHADLYWALRGGGNNLGIVTVFRFFTVPLPQGLVWGGGLTIDHGGVGQARVATAERWAHDGDSELRAPPHAVYGGIPPLLDAFYNITVTGVNKNPKASHILAVVVLASAPDPHNIWMQGSVVASTMLQYTAPVTAIPSVFEEYFTALKIPPWSQAFMNRTLSNLTELFSQGQPAGKRNMYWTATSKMDRAMMDHIVDYFLQVVAFGEIILGLSASLMFQSISTPMLKSMRKNGGNPLGLDGDEPRMVVTVVMSWDNSTDDAAVHRISKSITRFVQGLADEIGRSDDFVYNASQHQSVVAGYGEGNRERLVEVARKYDPEGVFQELQPGYHNLLGSPQEDNIPCDI
ncbi:Uu.00g096870.m01.CDS01 [Anthostomella pinea]|uniref:Uu.00g096870.m01.CDS01 n=1 Tax=Anthostomella pinea TaxID=933095 RepID=A0AAI8YF42_9PEZI|nr:Uu.00g096870.m01.CDS01 [Anthostomella pinea]